METRCHAPPAANERDTIAEHVVKYNVGVGGAAQFFIVINKKFDSFCVLHAGYNSERTDRLA
jgi:hypothetical protein